jgi:hypothetical protein
LLIRMNAFASASPSRVAVKSVNGSDEGDRFLDVCAAGTCGTPSNKNATGTCRIWTGPPG